MRDKQLCFLILTTFQSAVHYCTKCRTVQALKTFKLTSRGSIHFYALGHASALPWQGLRSSGTLCFPYTSNPCEYSNPEKLRCAGQVMVHFWWLERFSQIKFQNSKPRPTFLTQGIPKPCKPQHLELQQLLQGLLIRQRASHSLMKNSLPSTLSITSEHRAEQPEGAARAVPQHCLPSVSARENLSGWRLHACCSGQGSVPAALLGAWLFASLVGTFILAFFFPTEWCACSLGAARSSKKESGWGCWVYIFEGEV